ncbi:MAG: Lipoprotein [Oscillospiraceae bacterium]
MKKIRWVILILLVVVCGGILLYTNGTFFEKSPLSSDVVPETSSETSSVSDSSATPSSASESVSAADLTDDQIVEKIKSEIPLDWEKYTLKELADNPVSTGGVTYRTYSTWDDDYMEGPLILYNPEDGQLYTYTYQDSAPILASQDPAFDKTEHTVTGVVKDAAMMSVQIHTTDGNDLTVRRLGVELVNLDDGFKIGKNVKVTYTGVYKGGDSQRMFVTKIEGID